MIPDTWSTTIRNRKRKLAVSLGLSLMALAGRLVVSGKRLENAESFAPTATENTPSSNRDTTRTKTFKGNLEFSRQGISLTYDNPHDFLHDVVNGNLHPRNVTLEQWLIAHSYAMIDQKLPHLHTNVMVGGQLFGLHHCIESIHYPTTVSSMEQVH